MSVNVKLGNNIINDVSKVKLEDATTSGTYHTFNNLLNNTVNFIADSVDYSIVSVKSGVNITAPATPLKSGYVFKGWGLTDSATSYISFPYAPSSAELNLYAVYQAASKAIVEGLGSSSPSSVSFNVDSSFDFNFEEVTIGNDVFIKIPTMYRKVDTVVSSQITKFTISNAKIDNTYEPYPCFLDESGNLLEYVLIGKYWISSTTVANSVNASAASMTIGTGRTLCQAKTDASYQGLLYDWQIHKLWQDLIICAKQTVNTNSGVAWTTDELGIYWGTNGCWIDGLTYNSGSLAVSYKPSAYTDNAESSTTDYVSIGYSIPSATNGANIVKLGYDSNNPFVNMPSAASGSTYTTYYCDILYTSSGNHPFYCGVGLADALYGAFYSYFNGSWSNTSACRLCLRPIA